MAKKDQYWKKHIASWQASGLPQVKHCRKHGISAKPFGYHKRRLTIAETQDVVPVSKIVTSQSGIDSDSRSIRLHVGDTFMLDLALGFCQQTLKRILTVIDG